MNILYSCDNNYADIMGISMISLFENNKDSDVINVYFIDAGISEENTKHLYQIGEMYKRTVIIVPMIDIEEKLNVKLELQEWALAAYSRLFLSDMLDSKIDKILYIDCDTIINGSLQELWNTNIDNYLCAGVLDCLSCFKSTIGFDLNEEYYNSGVLLINIKGWRKNNTEQAFAQYIIERGGKIDFADQSVANAVMKGKYYKLEAKYNVMSPVIVFPYRNMALMNDYSNYYTEEEYNEAKNNPVIVHFTNGIYVSRPWIENCKHPYTDEFIKYKNISPWKDNEPKKDKRSIITQIFDYIKGAKNHLYLIVWFVQNISKRRKGK